MTSVRGTLNRGTQNGSLHLGQHILYIGLYQSPDNVDILNYLPS
jgi:hypothetical protein